jgi:hypothetical protein
VKRILVLISTFVLLSGLLVTGAPSIHAQSGPTQGGFATDNIEYVGFVPFDQSTSTGATIIGANMYLTSWKNLSIYDITDPTNPVQTAMLPVGFMFENEDVAVSPDQSFMLFSESLPNDILHVYNVEDKTAIVPIAEVEGAGDHTTSCILRCTYAYGSDGSITDLRNPAEPKVVALDTDPNNWHAKINLQGGGHDVTEYKNGFILVSPLNGAALLVDVRDPADPKVIATGDDPIPSSERGYLWHSGEWPRNGDDRWILMQGEDNANPQCHDKIGPFATFDTKGGVGPTQPFKLTDTYKVTNGTFTDGNPPANALGCSAHWFETHRTFNDGGLVTIAFYEHGTRFLRIMPDGAIKKVGHFLAYGGSTSAAYWVDDEIVYSVDYTRGIDILRWTGPTFVPKVQTPKLPGPLVRLRVTDETPKDGQEITFFTRLERCAGHEGTNIQLRKKVDGHYETIATTKLDANCRAQFKQTAAGRSVNYRTWWPKQHDDHRRGKSEPVTVNTSA